MKQFLACCLMLFLGVLQAMPFNAAKVVLKEGHEKDQQKSGRNAQREADIKAKAELLGLGTDVKIVTRSPRVIFLRGIIENFSSVSLGIRKGGRVRQIKYRQIDTLRLAMPKYKAHGQVDPVTVRRIVIDLGMDKKVKLKLVSDRKIEGRILVW